MQNQIFYQNTIEQNKQEIKRLKMEIEIKKLDEQFQKEFFEYQFETANNIKRKQEQNELLQLQSQNYLLNKKVKQLELKFQNLLKKLELSEQEIQQGNQDIPKQYNNNFPKRNYISIQQIQDN